MLVVSDTAPLNYLGLIGEIGLLPKVFGRVLIPPAVHKELTSEKTPVVVRLLQASPPSWLEIRKPARDSVKTVTYLDAGESEAIALALETAADLVLIDERAATQVARDLGLTVTGTLGVLDQAAALGLIDLAEACSRLQQTNFFAPAELIARLLETDAQRKRRD